MNFFTSTISCVASQSVSVSSGGCDRLADFPKNTDLWTGAVNQTPVGLEGDVGGIDEGLHLLCRLVAEDEGHQGVGVSVALQDVHVLVSAVAGLMTAKNKVILIE